MKRRWKLLCLVLLAGALLLLYDRNPITAEQLMDWQPQNLFLSALLLLLLFAVKSVLVFVPILIPQILVGHLYPGYGAFGLNLLGLVVVMSVPHAIGRRLGGEKLASMLQRYPKLEGIMKLQQENELALSFMMRACAVPPADIVTMYLGASGMPLHTNVLGGVLGALPSMMMTTFLGANIQDPSSPAFWQALGLNIAWIVLSVLGFFLLRKFTPKEETA